MAQMQDNTFKQLQQLNAKIALRKDYYRELQAELNKVGDEIEQLQRETNILMEGE